LALLARGLQTKSSLKIFLFGWTGNKDLFVKPLQPKENGDGNWDKVFKYCESTDFKGAFSFYDFVVIQIDTDFMHRGEVAKDYKIDLKGLAIEQVVDAFRSKIIQLIGESFYVEYANQIIFAIAVNEIECWFLPVYFSNQKAKYSKTVNCIETLNEVLPKKEGFYIDEKKNDYYQVISKHFRKKKDIQNYSSKNLSFNLFICDLASKIS